MPTPVASYRTLATNQRYLKGAAFESGESVLVDEDRKDAELQAAVEIESGLGKTFAAPPDTPPIIRLLGDLLGSAIVWEFVAVAKNLGKDDEALNKPRMLRKAAMQIIADLRAHKIGVLNLDGSFDATYPQPSILPTVGVGGARPLAIDAGLAWGQMAAAKMSDTEKVALDVTRERRAYDIEAAYAGAYGV